MKKLDQNASNRGGSSNGLSKVDGPSKVEGKLGRLEGPIVILKTIEERDCLG